MREPVKTSLWMPQGQRAVSMSPTSWGSLWVASLDQSMAQACGELCAATSTSDVIDASVVLVAREHQDTIVTSDVEDLRRLDPSARLERI